MEILEFKSMIREVKNSQEGLNGRTETAEERTHEPEDRPK